MADPSPPADEAPQGQSVGNPWLAALAAWLVPGGGHFLLGRRARAVGFFVLVLTSLTIGCQLDGKLSTQFAGHPLEVMRTLGCLGTGLPYVVLRIADYSGRIEAAGYEYGSAFVLTAGLMNLLLVLDAWDVSRGRKP